MTGTKASKTTSALKPRNYCKQYIDALRKGSAALSKSLVRANLKHISSESQIVYTLMPSAYNYLNTDGACKQLCLFSSALFFDSSSLLQYSKTLAGALMTLSSKDKHSILSKFKKFFGKSDVFDKRLCKSKFISGSEIATEIMRRAIELDSGHKISLIFVIGQHALNVLIVNTEDHITILFYDPDFSQIYKQSVYKHEIDKALNNHANFVNLMSILNSNGVLLGKPFFKHFVDPNMSFVMMTQCSDSPKNTSITKVEFASNVPQAEVIKYLGKNPAMFHMMFYIMNKDTFRDFLAQNKAQILKAINVADNCIKLILQCSKSEHLNDMLVVYSKTDGVRRGINNNYDGFLYEDDSSKAIVDKPGKICIKEATFKGMFDDGLTEEAEVAYLSIIQDERKTLWESISKCAEESSLKEKKKIAAFVCNDFTAEDSEGLEALREAYHTDRDTSEQKDVCFDQQQTVKIAGEPWPNTDDDLEAL